MRKCINCGEDIKDGDYCFQLPASTVETGIGITLYGEERLFCEWCGGCIDYSRLQDDEVVHKAHLSDIVDNGFYEDDEEE